jgi:hypothetical protein|tara:strand:- start:1305 stop:1604 length:300 start_codon:yes stop_codon:yes gene_type:complete
MMPVVLRLLCCAWQVADVSKLFLLSAQDCYVAGLNNIQRSFDGTFYSGTYGCRVDTGFTMPGLLAHNFRSDKRQHGALKYSYTRTKDTPLPMQEAQLRD